VYYKVFQLAQCNDHVFKVAAFVDKKSDVIGINNRGKMTSQYRRIYKNSDHFCHDKHAEVDLILKLRYVPRQIRVVRFLADGTFTMAKPCIHCQNFLRIKGVKEVRYTTWEGTWETMKLGA
jgi:hypothetical protein